jgi:hypothetical protein
MSCQPESNPSHSDNGINSDENNSFSSNKLRKINQDEDKVYFELY